MERVLLKDLNMADRKEALAFLKKLWNELSLLHKKAKKSNCDWQCKQCNKVYKTIHLLDELNEKGI